MSKINSMNNHPSSTMERAGNELNALLSLQKQVESGWGRLPDANNDEEVSEYIRQVVLCATDELHELLAEVHWKPWKTNRGIKDIDKYREELADVLHFVLDLYLVAGLTGKEMVEDYMSKHEENMRRLQDTTYKES